MALLLAGLQPGLVFCQKNPLTIGIVTGQLGTTTPQSFTPFTSYLDSRVGDAAFRMVQFATIEDLEHAVQQRQLDFAFATPLAMVEMNIRYGARAIATVMQPTGGGQNYPWLAGAAFVRDSQTGIRSLRDFRGKRIVALSPQALGGWQSVVRELHRVGIREDRDLGNLRFVFSFAKVAEAICNGTADIGTLGANAFETVENTCPGKFRVLPAPGGSDPRYPAPASTSLYPEEAFAVTREMDEGLISKVSTALLAIEPGSDVARAGLVSGFTAPLSYAPVQELMEELRLRPFESYGRLTFRQALQQYAWWISGVLLVFTASLTWALVNTRRLNIRLQATEEFRKRVFEGSHLPIVVMDAATHRYLDCNPAATAIYGFASREDTLSKAPVDVLTPVQPDGTAAGVSVQRYIDRAIAEGMVVFEWRHQRSRGEIWDARVHLMSFESGEQKLLQFTLEDITDRKRAEAELRLANFTLENASVGIFWGSEHGSFTRVNRVACCMTGYSEQELLRMSVADLDPSPPNDINGAVISHLRAGTSLTVESCHRHKDGHIYPVEVSACLIEFEGTEYVVSFVSDITARRKSEERQTTLASVVEASHDFICIGTLDGVVTYLNKGARDLSGLKNFDPADKLRAVDLLFLEERGAFESTVMAPLLRDGWVRSELRLRHFETGKPIPVEIEGILIQNAQGAPLCIALAARDLTERRQAEQTKLQLETRLIQAQKMEALGRLTGGIAHDFNNALMVILVYGAILERSPDLDDKQREAVHGINQAGQRSRELVRQLLGFSRQQVIAPGPLDLNQTIKESQQLLARLVGEDVELEVFPAPDLWNVLLDATQVNQVLMNLAANARDAMPHGGKLILETSNAVIDEFFARQDPAAEAGEYVMLAVSDTGTGIDAEAASHLFEPFFTTKETGEGTGLGLATVYGIVRQNRGFINVYSEPGRGATFKVYFPRNAGASMNGQAPVTGRPKRETEQTVEKATGSVLLVEDDELVRNVMAETLRMLGYTPLIAANGSEALTICGNLATPIDLVISDMVMPGINGGELRDRLIRIRPGLRVLFVSGYASNAIVRREDLKSGVHFLQKPFSVESLKLKIQEILV